MKLNLSEFDQIIFDMDGVITSESIYWDTAALTAYELLFDYRYYGKQEIDRQWCRENVAEVADIVFCGGKTIRAVKKLGVNTNWDLAYVVFCISRYLEPDLCHFDAWHFESVCMFIENMTALAPELYKLAEGLAAAAGGRAEGHFARSGTGVWQELYHCFQNWFLGCGGLPGLNELERPLLPLEEIQATLRQLTLCGISLGIGTGRPRAEIEFPIRKWNIARYFDKNHIVTYDEVRCAEEELPEAGHLAKPNPYVFLKAAMGLDSDNRTVMKCGYPEDQKKKVLVVGDAPSDLLAAQAAGFRFAAVLTGVEGQDARGYFEENGADDILEDMTGLANKE